MNLKKKKKKKKSTFKYRGRVMMLNTTFNNISNMSWRSVLLVEETGVFGKNHRRKSLKTLSHGVVSSTPRHEGDCNS